MLLHVAGTEIEQAEERETGKWYGSVIGRMVVLPMPPCSSKCDSTMRICGALLFSLPGSTWVRVQFSISHLDAPQIC